jgi:hypothetical protein
VLDPDRFGSPIWLVSLLDRLRDNLIRPFVQRDLSGSRERNDVTDGLTGG